MNLLLLNLLWVMVMMILSLTFFKVQSLNIKIQALQAVNGSFYDKLVDHDNFLEQEETNCDLALSWANSMIWSTYNSIKRLCIIPIQISCLDKTFQLEYSYLRIYP